MSESQFLKKRDSKLVEVRQSTYSKSLEKRRNGRWNKKRNDNKRGHGR